MNLRLLGFGVVRIVGMIPDEARVGDIAVEVAHSGFYTHAQVWLKVIDGARGCDALPSHGVKPT